MDAKFKKDHCIGQLNLLYSSFPTSIYVRNVKNILNRLAELDLENFEDGHLHRNAKEPIDFLDNLEGYGKWFNYCPWCGEKIDLDKIKKELLNAG